MANFDILTDQRVELLLNSAASEVPKVIATLVLLGIGWLIGKRLSVLWSREQKQREQDLVVARDFHRAYGEFFATWKQWNYFLKGGTHDYPGGSRWTLLRDACQAEATLEATFVRLATERRLTTDQIKALGRFRHIFQLLREAIRDGKPLEWDHSEHPLYAEFKLLAPRVAAIIGSNEHVDDSSLVRITSNIFEVRNRATGERLGQAS